MTNQEPMDESNNEIFGKNIGIKFLTKWHTISTAIKIMMFKQSHTSHEVRNFS